MMKVYICPECGWMRVVSRRKDVECHRCGDTAMVLTNLSMVKYSDMNEEQRTDYSLAWMYIHKRKRSSNDR